MNTRVFAEKGRVKLVGDERDVGVAAWWRDAVWQWCEDNKINLEYQGTLYQGTLAGIDLWRIKDEEQRAWFILRWA